MPRQSGQSDPRRDPTPSLDRPGVMTRGRPADGADHQQSGRRARTTSCGRSRTSPSSPTWHIAAGMAGVVRRTYPRQRGQPARVDGAHHDVGVAGRRPSSRPRRPGRRGRRCRERARARPRPRASRSRRTSASSSRRRPALEGPGAEPLLEVRRETGPRGHVAEVVTVDRERVRRDQPGASVAKTLAAAACAGSRASRAARRARGDRRSGSQGDLGVPPAQHLPVVGVRRDVVDPRAARAPGRAPRRRRSCAARPAESTSEVPSSNQCSRRQSSWTSSSSFSSGRPVLRNRSRTTAGRSVWVAAVPGEAVGGHRHQRAAELALLDQRHRVAELGQPQRGGEAAEAAADHHHPGHGRTLGASRQAAGSRSRPFHRRQPRRTIFGPGDRASPARRPAAPRRSRRRPRGARSRTTPRRARRRPR